MVALIVGVVLLVGGVFAAGPAGELDGGMGQIGQELELVAVPGEKGAFYQVQRTREGDGRLFLTANNVFFAKGRLVCGGKGLEAEKSDSLNRNNAFEYIGNWNDGDQAEWGLWFEKAGEVTAFVQTSGSDEAVLSLELGGEENTFKTAEGEGSEGGTAVRTTFEVAEPGFYQLEMTCKRGDGKLRVHWVELRGSAIDIGGVGNVRWRPAAAHTKFSSSKVDGPIRAWVMEMDAVAGDQGFYSPVTTPFGYYGPTWQADGKVGVGFNFSLWSYGRGKKEPPMEELSHLLAVGSPKAEFGGFGHEGTGVKVRGWAPLEGRQGQRQAISLRIEPGEKYDTYYSYFYATDEGAWKLFGVGNKYNKRQVDAADKSLWVGSFVEVPGPPHRQRTGPYERRMRYRGWVMDAEGEWYPLDRMRNGNINRKTGLTHAKRGVDDGGWFYLQTGGWKVYRGDRSVQFIEHPDPTAMGAVEYMGADDLAAIKTVPCEIEMVKADVIGGELMLAFEVRGAGGKVTAYWGETDCLTLADRWASSKVVSESVKMGLNTASVPNVSGDGDICVRLLLENEQGRFFSEGSYSVEN